MSFANVCGYNIVQQAAAANVPVSTVTLGQNKPPEPGADYAIFDMIPLDVNTGAIQLYGLASVSNIVNSNAAANPPNPRDPVIDTTLQLTFLQAFSLINAHGNPVDIEVDSDIVSMVTTNVAGEFVSIVPFCPVIIPITEPGLKVKLQLKMIAPMGNTIPPSPYTSVTNNLSIDFSITKYS